MADYTKLNLGGYGSMGVGNGGGSVDPNSYLGQYVAGGGGGGNGTLAQLNSGMTTPQGFGNGSPLNYGSGVGTGMIPQVDTQPYTLPSGGVSLGGGMIPLMDTKPYQMPEVQNQGSVAGVPITEGLNPNGLFYKRDANGDLYPTSQSAWDLYGSGGFQQKV